MSEPEKPTSGSHLAQILEVELEESVVVAVFPETIEEITTKEVPFTDGNNEYMHVALVTSKAWGVRAMDVLAPNEEKVKWWRAKAIIQDQKLDMIPVRYQGPIAEIPQSYFENDYVLAIRFVDAGPWFFPKEQLKTEVDARLEEAVDAAVKPAGG